MIEQDCQCGTEERANYADFLRAQIEKYEKGLTEARRMLHIYETNEDARWVMNTAHDEYARRSKSNQFGGITI